MSRVKLASTLPWREKVHEYEPYQSPNIVHEERTFECLAQTLSVFSPNAPGVWYKRKNALFFMPVFESFFHGPLLFSSSPLLLPLSFFFFIFFFIKGCRGKSFFFVFCFFLLRFSGDFSRDIGGIILLFQPSYFTVSVPPLLQAS